MSSAGMGRMDNGQGAGGEMMQCVKVGKLNLVDLAGSERVHITGATGKPPSRPLLTWPHTCLPQYKRLEALPAQPRHLTFLMGVRQPTS